MQKGDVILVDYTGRELSTGSVFETTLEAKAKETSQHDPRIAYKPVPIVLGRHEMLVALEDEMEKMNVGETKRVVLEPAKAFGDRDAHNIRVASARDFREHKLVPYPGMIVDVNGAQGRVQSVSGGRVRIDFNHPLAGKQIEYEVTIRQKLDSLQEQAAALFDKFFPFVTPAEKKVSESKGVIVVDLPPSAAKVRHLDLLKQAYTNVLKEQLKGVQDVSFLDQTMDSKSQKKSADASKPKASDEPVATSDVPAADQPRV